MVRITETLLARKAEHNDCMLRTLEEIALHNLGIERIEVINQACRHLRILWLQSNIICRIEQLYRLKELEELNLAVNNIQRIQNLQRCESLRKLDLMANFIDKAGLLTLHSLQENEHLTDLTLLGNPCTQWPGYRAYVVGTLPHLKSLDSTEVLPSERISAAQQLPGLQAQLRRELLAEGIDPDEAAQVEDDSLLDADHIPETGMVGEDGQLRRPWCPATRILDQREAEAREAALEEQRRQDRERAAGMFGEPPLEAPPRLCFPEVVDGQPFYQKNEGHWEHRLDESSDGRSIQLDVVFGKYLDTSAIQIDLQPTYVRLLAKGQLLQLLLPKEVAPDAAAAHRSRTTGNLLMTMPVADHNTWLAGLPRPAASVPSWAGEENAAGASNGAGQRRGGTTRVAAYERDLPAAVITTATAQLGCCSLNDCGEDDLPPL